MAAFGGQNWHGHSMDLKTSSTSVSQRALPQNSTPAIECIRIYRYELNTSIHQD